MAEPEIPPELIPTWDQLNRMVQRMVFEERGEWAGTLLPLPGMQLRVHDRHPQKAELEAFTFEADVRVCTDADVDETAAIRNRWYSPARGGYVLVIEEHGRITWGLDPSGPGQAAALLLQTFGATRAWPYEAEVKAIEKLAELVTATAFRQYLLTGAFIESSRRSGLFYVFRRLRPTLAIRGEGETTRILAALCLHPIGFYAGTWAGAMVPTDDVLAHLLLMRGDEARFWRQAEQHPPWAPEAGLCA